MGHRWCWRDVLGDGHWCNMGHEGRWCQQKPHIRLLYQALHKQRTPSLGPAVRRCWQKPRIRSLCQALHPVHCWAHRCACAAATAAGACPSVGAHTYDAISSADGAHFESAISTPTVDTMGATTIESRCRSTMSSSKSYSSGHDRPACVLMMMSLLMLMSRSMPMFVLVIMSALSFSFGLRYISKLSMPKTDSKV